MKKLFLLLVAGSFAVSLSAQERHSSIVFSSAPQQKQSFVANQPIEAVAAAFQPTYSSSTARTTSSTLHRWYIYGDYLTNALGIGNYGFNDPYLWNDTTSKDAFGNGTGGTVYDYNNFVSMGLSLDPSFSGFNDPAVYADTMVIGATNNYTIDSVLIQGNYQRSFSSAAKIAIVDTIRVALVYGTGVRTSDLPTYEFNDGPAGTIDHTKFPYPQYSVDTLKFIDMQHDSLHNTAKGATVQHIDLLLTSADTSFFLNRSLSFPSYNVPAGNYAAMSLTFISGDHTFTRGDTVFGVGSTGNSYKYGMFRPIVVNAGTSAAPIFSTYTIGDQNMGYYKQEGSTDGGWQNLYIPQWAYSSATGASGLQYPYWGFHVSCTGCSTTSTVVSHVSVANLIKTIQSVNALPNPANGTLNIAFMTSQVSDVTITLTNMIGQVVAAQQIANTVNGNAVFNTASLPVGVYIYTVNANNERSIGQVVIAH